MASTVRIPPELFEEILSRVEDEHDLLRDYEDRAARKRALRSLATCSSVCAHWANFIRPGMFQLLVLRSAQDLYDLLALLRMPCSPRIRSIAHCLRTVVVFYRFKDYFWCHNLQRLHTYGVHAEVSLRIHISGSTPRKKECTVRHPLFYTIPRMVPFHLQQPLHVDLILDRISFPNGTGLLNLMRDISSSGILPRFVRSENLFWGDELSLPLATLNPTSRLNQFPCIKPFSMTTKRCTDNFLATFAAHSCIVRRGRGVSMLNPSDANRFLSICGEWANLVHEIVFDPFICQICHPIGSLGRQKDSRLSKDDQAYVWGIRQPGGNRRQIAVFGCRMHLEQLEGQDSDGAHTAHITSIGIAIYSTEVLNGWDEILHKSLEFPMLDTIQVRVLWPTVLRDFVGRHRKILAVAESRGKLRLLFSHRRGGAFKKQNWRRVGVNDALDLNDADVDTLSTLEEDTEEEVESREKNIEPDVDISLYDFWAQYPDP